MVRDIFQSEGLLKFKCTQRLMSRFLCFGRLNQLLTDASTSDGHSNIFNRMLKLLDIRLDISGMDYARIPATGKTVVVANHPFGGIEGVILGSILSSRRPDVKIMANNMLGLLNLSDFSNLFIYVDPFARDESIKSNIKPIRESLNWLKNEGMLGIFPAGEVSHFHLRKREVTDPEWSCSVARIIRKSGATVLPVFFEGSNCLAFQLLGLLHPRIRTVMLPREMLNKSQRNIHVRIGKALSFEKLRRLKNDGSMMQYLRLKTYMLGNRKTNEKRHVHGTVKTYRQAHERIVPAQAPELLADEVRALPIKQLLFDTGKFCVYIAESQQIPHLLQEMGRLREITFRQVGEGTGKATDLDRFDSHYLHLFLWNCEAGEIAGGYRLGLTDCIISQYGKEGLYTSTLFEYQPEFLERIGPAIELGRSFVCPQYHKTYQPLMLLWKGIGRFVSARPRYRSLFGPVSVSNEYHSISRQLIVAFSKQNCHRTDLARFVRGNNTYMNPFKKNKNVKVASKLIRDIRDLSELISDIERDQKGIPILLKHYMKLGGEFLAFSMDYNFSGVMDVLILVDLVKANRGMLKRYMGPEGARSFLTYDCTKTIAACA